MAPRGRSTTLSIGITADDKGASKAFGDTRREVASLGTELESLALKAGGALAVYRGFGKLQGAAEAASTLREMQATTNQVFRESEQVVRSFASSAGDRKSVV